ncbi:MAG TPA: alanine/glycine:cation symporter family protein [Nocardioidaceae bacterium]|nr:alanine/glycine:cation symporter family protein [Nocardioidaceae bacterium]
MALPLAASTDDGGGSWLGEVESTINAVFDPISAFTTSVIFYEVSIGAVTFPIIVAWLVIAGAIFTIYFKGVQVTGFPHAIARVRGKYSRHDDPGEVTHFQALASALSGTVGLGNIAGVAVAVTLGGPGATFWMILAGLLGMCTKFVECTLGQKYRTIHEDGTVTGGPFKYLPVAFARFGGVTSKGLTGVFAIAIFLFGAVGGNMFQANQTFAQAREVTGGADGPLGSEGSAFIFGLVMAVLVGAVILGGIKSIGAVTSRLVPAMAFVYVGACLFVIFSNLGSVPDAFASIIDGAFSPDGISGGVIGVLVIGFQRAAFSNEAGLGSAPTAHSAAKTRHPVSEGFVALLEPFVDTVIICTMTALTIIIAAPPLYQESMERVQAGGAEGDGVVLTSAAFETFIPQFPVILAIAVALFAFSTLITWAYYTMKAWTTLFGRTPGTELTFKVVYCVFTVVGTVLTLDTVLDFADSMLFLCAFVNLLACYLLLPVVKAELQDYMAQRRSGEITEVEAEAR